MFADRFQQSNYGQLDILGAADERHPLGNTVPVTRSYSSYKMFQIVLKRKCKYYRTRVYCAHVLLVGKLKKKMRIIRGELRYLNFFRKPYNVHGDEHARAGGRSGGSELRNQVWWTLASHHEDGGRGGKRPANTELDGDADRRLRTDSRGNCEARAVDERHSRRERSDHGSRQLRGTSSRATS